MSHWARRRRRHGSPDAPMTNFEVTAEEITDKEIGLWKLRTVPLPKTDDPLMEWKLCGDKNVCPLGRIVPDCSHMDFPVSLRAIQAMLAFTIVIIARVLSME